MVMRSIFSLIFVSFFLLTACSPVKQAVENSPSVDLPDLGIAPELTNTVWINTPNPLRLADLQGKVVIIEMWTFGCINCRNVIPNLIDWHNKYSSEGLVIIGNHFPEFDRESVLSNLEQAVKDLKIPYAVTEDNLGETWQAYNTHYWPSLYLIDKRGHIRYTHIGEGKYQETEDAIVSLLNEKEK
jgi:thiol-disulfide isomerase/thioredoxin